MEIFENLDNARQIVKEKKLMLIECKIERTLNGKYELTLRASPHLDTVNDDLTDKVFVYNHNDYKYYVREINVVDTNAFYVKTEDADVTDQYKEICDSFEQAYNKAMTILKTVEEYRKKVREGNKKFVAWVVI